MTTIQQIKLDKIKPGNNDRTVFKSVELAELAASITQDGLIQPITVRPITGTDHFEIVAGERRFRAFSMTDSETIPAIVRPLDDRTCSRIMLIENLQRADIDPIDEAKAYQSRIDEFGLTVAEMAEWAKVSTAKIRNRLGLLKLMPEVQHLIRFGNMPLVYATPMAPLNKNFQLIAFRYFTGGKRPLIAEFRALCSGLLEKQNQISMFDLDEFMTKPIESQIADLDLATDKMVKFEVFGIKVTIEYQPIKFPAMFKQVRA